VLQLRLRLQSGLMVRPLRLLVPLCPQHLQQMPQLQLCLQLELWLLPRQHRLQSKHSDSECEVHLPAVVQSNSAEKHVSCCLQHWVLLFE
jgi:hypothetical protein